MEDRYLTATTKNVRESAQKVRLTARLLKGLNALEALQILELMNQKAARFLKNTVKSAISNATVKGLTPNVLKIDIIKINEAVSYKRMMPASRGRGNIISKRGCHIYIRLKAE